MMLCRAKRKDNGEWVEGQYLNVCSEHYIIVLDGANARSYDKVVWIDSRATTWVEVDPATVCRQVGLKDKNGEEIWERDICEWHDSDGRRRVDSVTFGRGEYYLCNSHYGVGHYSTPTNIDIIGNIHDNPELLDTTS